MVIKFHLFKNFSTLKEFPYLSKTYNFSKIIKFHSNKEGAESFKISLFF